MCILDNLLYLPTYFQQLIYLGEYTYILKTYGYIQAVVWSIMSTLRIVKKGELDKYNNAAATKDIFDIITH